jgi:hypothetical protein
MNEKLRAEYVAHLAAHGLAPRTLPDDREALDRAVLEHLTSESRAARDDFVADLLEETYRQNRERYEQETRHPATVLIERTAERVEQSIRAIERYRPLFRDDVFAGEFPTGVVNAQAVSVDGGFLVLVNSGLLTVVQQITEFLVAGDPDRATDGTANVAAIDGVVAVLEAYLRFGDPFFGPKPMSGGMAMLLRSALSRATQAFVVAHEYAHVIAGHFDDRDAQLEQLATSVGPVGVIKKSWRQELEADTVAHKILLGVDDYAAIDLAAIDQAFAPGEASGSVLGRALELKAAIAAPLIVLTIDAIVTDVVAAARRVSGVVRADATHPPARVRMDNLITALHGLGPRYTGFINFAGILWAHADEIEGRLARSLLDGTVAAIPAW